MHSFSFISALASAAVNRNLWLFAAPAALLLYYLVAWISIGPEPEPGPLVTRYAPPDGFSAAAVRFLTTTGSDGRSFAAVIAQLAVSGCVRVEPEDGKYKISRLVGDRRVEAGLAPEEQRVLRMLFEDGPVTEMTASLEERNTAQQGLYVFHIQEELSKRLKEKYFTRHVGVIAAGMLASVAMALVSTATVKTRGTFETAMALFFMVWMMFCGLTLGMIVEVSFIAACRATARAGTSWLKLLPGAAALAAFAAVIAYMLRQLAHEVSPTLSLMIVAFLAVNLAWAPFFKRTTLEGRRILDDIAGFRLFLEKVEQDRLDKLNPPQEILQAREKYLAYAIALEVKEAWGDHLAQTFFASTPMR